METIKCQLNNIVSSPGAKAATGDISNMYLNSFLPEGEEEYVRFHLDHIPDEFIGAYCLREMAGAASIAKEGKAKKARRIRFSKSELDIGSPQNQKRHPPFMKQKSPGCLIALETLHCST